MIGQTISHYKILEKLGEGGMGVVYKAQDLKLDRLVALKFLPQQFLASQEEVARFQQEAKTISTLNHPSISTIHDVDHTDEHRFIVLEYLPGGTLKAKLRQLQTTGRELSVGEVVEYGVQIAEGLSHAHRLGIVHRDVKTDNIMLTEEGKVKITDFGLAKLRGTAHLTKTGTTVGTAAYMSPEQVLGEEVDHRSDLFSLGVVLYELATGHLPFRGEHEAAVSYAIVNESPAPVGSLRPGLPEGLKRVINCCLEKDKEKRYQNAEEIVADLKKVRQEILANIVKPTKSSKVRLITAAAVVVFAVVAIFVFYPKQTVSLDRKSIAVLPFKNLSDDKQNEFFSDGITEDIITQLSNIRELKVISRTSVMRYKNTDKSLREIGKELNVAAILEGSVRRADNEIRIVAQLIDVNTDEHLWAQTYDKELTKIFVIQSEISQQIATALRAQLSPAEKERIEKKPTENLDAYTYYLKGRQYYYRYHKQDNENAITLFKKALELDPDYALAYAGLGDAFGQRVGKFGFPSTWLDSSVSVSMKAISIDPKLAEAYKALGLAYQFKGWNSKALEAYRKSVDFNPNYVPAVGNIGFTFVSLGKFDEALPWMKKSVALDPTFAFQYFGTGLVYLNLDDLPTAERWFRKALELQPDFIYAHAGLCLLYVARGDYERAVEQSQTMLAIVPNEVDALAVAGTVYLFAGKLSQAREYYEKIKQEFTGETPELQYRNVNTGLGYVYSKMGSIKQAHEVLLDNLMLDERNLRRGSESLGPRLDMAAINAIQGNKAEAYRWLQQAIDAGWRGYRLALEDPLFESIRNDDPFKQMMAQVKAKVNEMRRRVEQANQQ